MGARTQQWWCGHRQRRIEQEERGCGVSFRSQCLRSEFAYAGILIGWWAASPHCARVGERFSDTDSDGASSHDRSGCD